MRLLIVEDEALVALLIEEILLSSGYEVAGIADDYESALSAVDRNRPDLALVDICLAQGSNGIQVAAAFAERGIPSLFVTGNCPGEEVPAAIGCVHKPFTEESLAAAVASAERLLRGERVATLPPNMHVYSNATAGSWG